MNDRRREKRDALHLQAFMEGEWSYTKCLHILRTFSPRGRIELLEDVMEEMGNGNVDASGGVPSR